jgi:hypothetical protein
MRGFPACNRLEHFHFYFAQSGSAKCGAVALYIAEVKMLARRVRDRGQNHMASKCPQFEGVDVLKNEQRRHLPAMVDVMGHDSPDSPLP